MCDKLKQECSDVSVSVVFEACVLQSVFYIMAGVETCFLKLSEELNGRNQVQKM